MKDDKYAPHNEDGSDEDLNALRERIDDLDHRIMALISERAECASTVARVKLAESPEAIFYRPEREAQVLKRIMALNPGPLANEEMARLFREIMSACLALEKPLRVAYLGPEGTFTQQAALKHFGDSAICTPLPAIDEVFREVEAGAVNYGVVPVENSTEGIVNHTLDSFMDSSLRICGEVVLRIHHHLLVGENTRRDKVSRIYSHSQSLAQCRKWLDAHYPHAERVAVSSNAEAARRVKSEWHTAAIAGDMAARLYALERLDEKIEDQPDNATRFLIIGNHDVPPSGEDRTSLVAAMRNQPGALHDLIEPFQRHEIDMTRLETRPSRHGAWNYVFFIDFRGHLEDPRVRAALDEVHQRASDVRLLGSYPMGVL
ncbi:prephenate dehydratase [Kushneria aurantia]|uniref:Bifunctional chorismate mutase/prephenate dehydratase n=1 Tax=Kushneria aurantia TaxID=504092 RepID=A0ABV6G001_9GAMM|nr:prephenate dehydratase [Kushneria aurantia]